VADTNGTLYAFHPWLTDQLTRSGVPTEQVTALVYEQRRLFADFGGKPPKSVKGDARELQTNIELASLKGRELAFVEGLRALTLRLVAAVSAVDRSAG
jgi:hypothetical protein